MAQKNFRAMAQTLIFWGFEPWLKPTFDMQILTSSHSIVCLLVYKDLIIYLFKYIIHIMTILYVVKLFAFSFCHRSLPMLNHSTIRYHH